MTRIARDPRLLQLSAMLGVLALAAVLRFYDLRQRGLIYWDESKFALEGERLLAYMEALLGAHVSLNAGKSIGTAKPTHALLIALGYALFGVHDYAPLFVDAFFSVVQVALLYVIGRRLFGPWAGVIAALFLAVSEYDVIYARSALSESDANAIFLAGVLFWVLDWERMGGLKRRLRGFPTPWLLPGALLAGASFTANYRMVIYILVVVVFDLVSTLREHGWRPLVGRLITWIPGLAAAPAAWQIVDLLARAGGRVLFRSEVNILIKSGGQVLFRNVRRDGPEWYLVQALFQLHGGKQSIIRFDPWIYLQWFVLRQGWAISLLLLVGLALAVRERLFPWVATAALVVVPYAIYSFAPFIVPRNLDPTLPFVSLLTAAALVVLVERIPRDVPRRAAVVVLACAIAAYGASLSWRLTGERSGFAQAAGYVHAHGGHGALSLNEVTVFYFPGDQSGVVCASPPVAGSRSGLAAQRAAGYRYVILDHSPVELTNYIERSARLAARFPAYGDISIGENPISTENGDPPDTAMNQQIDVYDLSTLPLPPASTFDPSTCDRNVPI